MEILSWILAMFGLVTSVIGIWFSYITYSNPMIRFKWYLKRKDHWKQIFPRMKGVSDYYQYSKHPEFTIEDVYDRRWERDEPWMKKVMRPDPACHASQIALKVNGNILHTETFLSMDGGRIFVPIPRVEFADTGKEDENVYYYDDIQVLLAGLLGQYHIYETLDKFCKNRILLDYHPSDTK